MKLNILERFTALGLLPKEGNYVTLNVIRELQSKLAPSEKEIKEFEIKQVGDQTAWNQKGLEEKEIEIGEKATDLIVEALEKLDKDKKLTLQHTGLYEKFIKKKD